MNIHDETSYREACRAFFLGAIPTFLGLFVMLSYSSIKNDAQVDAHRSFTVVAVSEGVGKKREGKHSYLATGLWVQRKWNGGEVDAAFIDDPFKAKQYVVGRTFPGTMFRLWPKFFPLGCIIFLILSLATGVVGGYLSVAINPFARTETT